MSFLPKSRVVVPVDFLSFPEGRWNSHTSASNDLWIQGYVLTSPCQRSVGIEIARGTGT